MENYHTLSDGLDGQSVNGCAYPLRKAHIQINADAMHADGDGGDGVAERVSERVSGRE